jgi:hypothetical protein
VAIDTSRLRSRRTEAEACRRDRGRARICSASSMLSIRSSYRLPHRGDRQGASLTPSLGTVNQDAHRPTAFGGNDPKPVMTGEGVLISRALRYTLSQRDIRIDADAWPTALVPPGDAAEERLGRRKPRIETCFASLALLQAASRGDLSARHAGRAGNDRRPAKSPVALVARRRDVSPRGMIEALYITCECRSGVGWLGRRHRLSRCLRRRQLPPALVPALPHS